MSDLPSDFNYKTYLSLNKDLNKRWSINETVNHYLQFGKNENRQYKKKINILVAVLSCKKHSHIWNEIKNRSKQLLIFTGSYNNTTFYDKKSKIYEFI
jgi:hypothetical protein